MRMDKNVRIDTIEKIIATASDIVKTVKLVRFINLGMPVLSSLPPGAVKAAENATVAIKAAVDNRRADSGIIFSSSCFLFSGTAHASFFYQAYSEESCLETRHSPLLQRSEVSHIHA
nr:hypothetical protein CFOL_v3_17882 [Ipomoea trifida]